MEAEARHRLGEILDDVRARLAGLGEQREHLSVLTLEQPDTSGRFELPA